MICERCKGTGWVCIHHPDQQFNHDSCSGSGTPCVCADIDTPPVRPKRENASTSDATVADPASGWLPGAVGAERKRLGIRPRTTSCAGTVWSLQDDYDLRYLMDQEGRGLAEIAKFLKRSINEVSARIKVPPPFERRNVITLADRIKRHRGSPTR